MPGDTTKRTASEAGLLDPMSAARSVLPLLKTFIAFIEQQQGEAPATDDASPPAAAAAPPAKRRALPKPKPKFKTNQFVKAPCSEFPGDKYDACITDVVTHPGGKFTYEVAFYDEVKETVDENDIDLGSKEDFDAARAA